MSTNTTQTANTLRAVTLQTVANARHAAERAVGAYRQGGHRLLAVLRHRADQAAGMGAGRLSPRLAAALQRANGGAHALAIKGVDLVSLRTERAIAAGTGGVNAQVARVARLAGVADNRVIATSLLAVARLSLPGAQAALALSEKLASGADTLYAAVSAPEGPQAGRAKPAARRTRKAAAPKVAAPKAASQAAAATTTTAATLAKRAGRAGRRVGQAADHLAAQADVKAQAVAKRVKAAAAQVDLPQASAKATRKAAAQPRAKTAKTTNAA